MTRVRCHHPRCHPGCLCLPCLERIAAWQTFVRECADYLDQPSDLQARRLHEACLTYVQTLRPKET